MSMVVSFLQSYFDEIDCLCFEKKYHEAHEVYLALYEQYSNNIELLNRFGRFLITIQRYQDSSHLFTRSLEIDPGQASIYCAIGVALCHMGRFKEAIGYYQKALSLDQDLAEAYSNLGATYHALQDFENGYHNCFKAVKMDKTNHVYLSNLANALNVLSRHEEALTFIEQAIKINSDFIDAYLNKGISLYGLFRYDEAIDSLQKCISLDPLNVKALTTCAACHIALREIDLAIGYLDQALLLAPGHAEASFSKACVCLLKGDLDQGFALYESRFAIYHGKNSLRSYQIPRLLDLSVFGKKILVYGEQGYGDCLQYCRYIPLLEQLGAKVFFQVPSSLVDIMKTLSTNIEVFSTDCDPKKFDYHTPIASLPFIFKTNINTIPSKKLYLKGDEKRTIDIQSRLSKANYKRVGFVFSGSKVYHKDTRSIPIKDFAQLFDLPLQFHCLQKEIDASDELYLKKFSNVYLHKDSLHSFLDTASLIECMDINVTVDTAVAHLCGAMGKSFLLLLPYVSDPRWLLDRSDSIWYSSAFLVRQGPNCDWSDVITNIHCMLRGDNLEC